MVTNRLLVKTVRKAIKIDENIHRVLSSVYGTQPKPNGSSYTNKTDFANDLLIEILKAKGLWLHSVDLNQDLYAALKESNGNTENFDMDQAVGGIVFEYLRSQGIPVKTEG